MKDEEIIKLMREKGDYSYVYGTLYEMCFGYVSKKGWMRYVDFDDVFQNSVLALNKTISSGSFKLSCKLSTFFVGILSKQAIKYMDSNSRVETVSIDSEVFNIAEKMDDEEESPKIKKLVNLSLSKLSVSQRKIVKLMYYEGKSQLEISEILGFSTSHSIKTQKYKAFKILRETIETELDGESLDKYLLY